MNGVSGHAGLFGTVQGVLEMVVHILNRWRGREEHPLYSNTLLQKALTRQYNDQTWCLGFDTPSPTESSGGSYLSKESVGHLGFTGTSFWIDPEKDMVIVLLTNRVYPSRDNEKIKQFRPLLHDTVFRAMKIQ
jgi:CubicO group peptidase (beta-lactamase class C family)